jgi:hypothetical protein
MRGMQSELWQIMTIALSHLISNLNFSSPLRLVSYLLASVGNEFFRTAELYKILLLHPNRSTRVVFGENILEILDNLL